MEQRNCLRLPLTLPVVLSTTEKTISCTTRNFGMGGMFLELAGNPLSIGEKAKVSFTLSQGQGHSTHCLNVVIARTTNDGLGIAFAQSNVSTFHSVQKLLKYSKFKTVH